MNRKVIFLLSLLWLSQAGFAQQATSTPTGWSPEDIIKQERIGKMEFSPMAPWWCGRNTTVRLRSGAPWPHGGKVE